MKYTGPCFHAIVWLGSFPPPPPLHGERETTWWRKRGGEGRARSKIIRRRESLVLYKSLNNPWFPFLVASLVPTPPALFPLSAKAEFMNVQFRWFSGHNLESSQTWGFCMNFLNHGGYGFLSGSPPFSFTVFSKWTVEIRKRLREFGEIKISRQSCRDDCK